MKRPAKDDNEARIAWLRGVDVRLYKARYRHPFLVLRAARWIAKNKQLNDGGTRAAVARLFSALHPALKNAGEGSLEPTDEMLQRAAKLLRDEAQEYPS